MRCAPQPKEFFMNKFLLLALLFLFAASLAAPAKHEASAYFGGFPCSGNTVCGHAGLGYGYFFLPNLGIKTGFEIASYNASLKLNDFRIDNANTIVSYKERQNITMLQFPLMLQFQYPIKITGIYAAAGGKIGLPVSGKYNGSGIISTEGSEYKIKAKGDQNFKTAFLISMETGLKWKIKDWLLLYTGGYLDYGLNNIKTGKTNFLKRNNASIRQSFTNEAMPISAGIKLSLAFGFGADKPKEELALPSPPLPNEETPKQEKIPKELKGEIQEVKKELEILRREYIADMQVGGYLVAQSDFGEIQQKTLDKQIALLKKYSNINFYIIGHTCDLGSPEVNEKLARERAMKAKEYMISQGIDETRILGISSKRDTDPLMPNDSEKNRSINRRVEIIIVE
jgi:outer membrane protein OmpA-like peptidoglycan-associated protein